MIIDMVSYTYLEPMAQLKKSQYPCRSASGFAYPCRYDVTNHTLQVKGTDTIGEVKTKYFEIDGTPVDQQNMILAGLALENSWTVAECGIRHESTIHLTRRLCGC
ncbi:unnamed protein product [Brassica napus]|uniref:(rape) hypothetical protein n=1 Tax=Brassica napus TaxID=3708 RepID=A0A816YPB3_BRANA|nr:unnamed protein product [Brassica napus]